jgi:hypothetical protein
MGVEGCEGGWVLGTGCWVLGAGCWVHSSGYSFFYFEFFILNFELITASALQGLFPYNSDELPHIIQALSGVRLQFQSFFTRQL